MSIDPPQAWHIDGWDLEGGRAFATRREQNVDLSENRPDWGPTVYINPPHFQPEIIVNVAVALSAARGAAFIPFVAATPGGDTEAAFPTAEAVAELVRRTFIGGGSGRGGEGGGVEGEPMPTPPDGQGSDEGGRRENAYAETDDISGYLQRMVALAHNESALHEAGALPLNDGDPGRLSVPSWRVEAGAAHLVGFLLSQAPVQANNPAWRQAATTLHRGIAELDLWNSWQQRDEHDSMLARIAHYWSHYLTSTADGDWLTNMYAHGAPAKRPVMAAACLLQDFHRFPVLARSGPYLVWLAGHGAQQTGPFDRFEAMVDWPVPPLGGPRPYPANAGALLSAFIASPAQYDRHPAVADIVCFLAALLSSRTTERTDPAWRERAAAQWLARSLPRWVFPRELEEVILAARLSREAAYAGPGAMA